MEMTVVNAGKTEAGTELKVGDTVRYLAHILGGMVRIEVAGKVDVAHPACFKELQ